ncbi:histidine--tRNA ligase [Exiguobacterium flavidum]|uniref:histidine--tRNA ligase n=1 Tax=Exiguobacterium flavidum TaxID=2184695 RepID=UPI000DF733D4|nr:histidine--tRNA ligase [Exiguobacterium flavidum]
MKLPRGTFDILPGTVENWQFVEQELRAISKRYNYKEIRTPIFEETELFKRGVGETTDIVQKEMFMLEKRGKEQYTLRPEGTAAVVRSFVTNKLFGLPNQPTKLFYIGPMFRYERPQAGRFRQLHQYGVEALGSEDPAIDAEVISLAMSIYRGFGLKKIKLVINSLGDADSRQAHRDALVAHFTPVKGELCQDCQNRLETNPLRVLDCKVDRDHPSMKTAPSILDFLNAESKAYFEDVLLHLDALGIEYVVDPTLVRGLDYYNHTAFEIMSEAEGFGAITTLCGGGRYNGLVEAIGGPTTPGIGFGIGIERLLMALENEGVLPEVDDSLDVFIVAQGSLEVEKTATRLLQLMRLEGLVADRDYLGRKFKGQFKAADRLKAKYTVILGDEEVERGAAALKDMTTGEQIDVPLSAVADTIVEKLKEETK